MRLACKITIVILGAGLPGRLVAARTGEAEEVAEAAGCTGRAVSTRRMVAFAAGNLLADRLDPTHWSHLPTLVAPGTVLLAAGTAALSLACPAAPQTYGVQAAALAVVAAGLVLARTYPHRLMAAVAVVLAAALAYEVPATIAADLSSYRQGTRSLPTDVLGTAAVLVVAAGVPAGLVPLGWRRGPLDWGQVSEVVRAAWWLRGPWHATAAALVVLAAVAVVNGVVLDPAPSLVVRAALAVDAAGLVVAALGVHASARSGPVFDPTRRRIL